MLRVFASSIGVSKLWAKWKVKMFFEWLCVYWWAFLSRENGGKRFDRREKSSWYKSLSWVIYCIRTNSSQSRSLSLSLLGYVQPFCDRLSWTGNSLQIRHILYASRGACLVSRAFPANPSSSLRTHKHELVSIFVSAWSNGARCQTTLYQKENPKSRAFVIHRRYSLIHIMCIRFMFGLGTVVNSIFISHTYTYIRMQFAIKHSFLWMERGNAAV